MNTVMRCLIYGVAVLFYMVFAQKIGANMNNWFVGFSVGVSAYCLFGWVLPRSKGDQSASDVGFAGGIYQAVGLTRREAATRRRKVQ